MSRIGKMPVAIPAGVEVTVADGNLVTVKGPKGTLTQQLQPSMTIKQEGAELLVSRPDDGKENRALHGLTRALPHSHTAAGCIRILNRIPNRSHVPSSFTCRNPDRKSVV